MFTEESVLIGVAIISFSIIMVLFYKKVEYDDPIQFAVSIILSGIFAAIASYMITETLGIVFKRSFGIVDKQVELYEISNFEIKNYTTGNYVSDKQDKRCYYTKHIKNNTFREDISYSDVDFKECDETYNKPIVIKYKKFFSEEHKKDFMYSGQPIEEKFSKIEIYLPKN